MYERTALCYERGEIMPDLIIFNCIAVNNIYTSAGVFIGDNAASSWDANNKNTSSINTVAGAGNIFTANLTLLSDNDFIDTPIVDSDVTGPTAQA
jgi:hypothetical protein